MKIGILIDSGGAITNEEILKTKNIDIIPLHVVLGDNTEFLDINENILKHNVFERVSNKEAVSTSMASPGELEEKYDEMLKIYDHIYHLTITPNLSGMKNTALMVDRKSTRLNSSHVSISYAVFCLKKKKKHNENDKKHIRKRRQKE